MLTPWKKSYDQLRQHIKKQRHYFANKGPSSEDYVFSSSHLWIWELDYKEGSMLKRRRQQHPTPVLLPGKSHGRRSLVGCSPWGRTELDMTERLHFHFSLSCTGEGNGNPLQCSCLENPRGGSWWAAIYGVAQSQTRLKRLSSSSSSNAEQLMLLNCGVGEDSWESLGLQGIHTSPS